MPCFRPNDSVERSRFEIKSESSLASSFPCLIPTLTFIPSPTTPVTPITKMTTKRAQEPGPETFVL